MIEGKYRYENEETWNYKDFNSEEEMEAFLDKDPKQVAEYVSRPKPEVKNPVKTWFTNMKNTKKNWKKVQSSPYASLSFAYKARTLIVWLLIPFIAWRIFDMVINFRGSGPMALIQKLFMLGIGIYICWKIYSTLPQAKKQIEYYKKYPHLINYVPTNTQETVDDILNKIKKNKEKEVKDGTGNKEKRV